MWILVFIGLLGFLALTRLYALDAKPFHHDESLFAYYGWIQSTGDYASHDPLLHGPLQIQILGFVFAVGRKLGILGDGFMAARLPAALCGIAFVFPLLGLRRQLGRLGILFAIVILSVSPAFWYYSRFCRNEMLMVFVTLALTLAILRAWRSRRPARWIAGSCLLGAALLCVKENALFLLFDAATFLVLTGLFAVWVARSRTKPGRPWVGAGHISVPRAFFRSVARRRYIWITGFAMGLVLLQVVYTNGFNTDWKPSFFGHYGKILDYWTDQHQEQRLYGEFHYYLPIIALYEPFVSFLVVAALVSTACRDRRFLPGLLLTILAAGLGTLIGEYDRRGWEGIVRLAQGMATFRTPVLLTSFHMTQPWQLGLAFVIGWLTLFGTWKAFRARRLFRAWLVWWTGLSLLQYGYAGEKVPWLAIHILLPMILLTADLMAAWWRKSTDSFALQQAFAVVFTICCVVNLAQGYRLCFVHPTNPGELLVYNHTQPQMHRVGLEMRDLCKASPKDKSLFIQGEAVWPLIWYIHGFDNSYVGSVDDPAWTQTRLLVCDLDYAYNHPEIEERFELACVPLRRAWMPEPLHPFTPLAKVVDGPRQRPSPREDRPAADLRSLGDNPSTEDLAEWAEGENREIREARTMYGSRAWQTLARYVVNRIPWDARKSAQPVEVYVGRPR
ncbi:TIGR03663 family protein [Candidatus Sumerlaeota bacterium]|nr:TIGR03663 family protein [Candidatus Sumerlaeota bacterium]